MKQFVLSVALAALALLPVGCGAKQEGGIPGTPNDFFLKVPKTSVSLHPGEKEQINVTLERHKEFKQGLDLSTTTSANAKGVTAAIDPKSIKPSDTAKATVTIEVASDADAGDSTVTVTATPNGSGTSAPASVDIKVKVKAKK